VPRITDFCSCVCFGCKLSLVRLCDFVITPADDITIGITCAAICLHILLLLLDIAISLSQRTIVSSNIQTNANIYIIIFCIIYIESIYGSNFPSFASVREHLLLMVYEPTCLLTYAIVSRCSVVCDVIRSRNWNQE